MTNFKTKITSGLYVMCLIMDHIFISVCTDMRYYYPELR